VAAPSPGRATGEQAGRGESFEPAFARVSAAERHAPPPESR